VRLSSCRGLNVVGVLVSTADVDVQRAVPGPKYLYMPDDIAKWSAYVRAVVDSFPQVRYWAIWNEPNDRGHFRGHGTEVTRDDYIASYKELIRAAAPHIRDNYDAQGRRFLVAPELGSTTPDERDYWLRNILGGPEGQLVDKVSVHAYGSASDIGPYMNSVASGAGIPWTWDVWLTEGSLTGCDEEPRNRRPRYCLGPDQDNIDDVVQASELRSLISWAQAASPSNRWTKTFYWHSHLETRIAGVGIDWGILGGANSNALFGRAAFTELGNVLAPAQASGPGYAYEQSAPASVAPIVPGSYYWVWDYRWCTSEVPEGYCTTTANPHATWSPYGVEGQDRTVVYPWVFSTDRWVEVKARQYAWAGGPLISDGGIGSWIIYGAGECPGCGGATAAAAPDARHAGGAGAAGVGRPRTTYPTLAERARRNR
jgi:hypothetical protein